MSVMCVTFRGGGGVERVSVGSWYGCYMCVTVVCVCGGCVSVSS